MGSAFAVRGLVGAVGALGFLFLKGFAFGVQGSGFHARSRRAGTQGLGFMGCRL